MIYLAHFEFGESIKLLSKSRTGSAYLKDGALKKCKKVQDLFLKVFSVCSPVIFRGIEIFFIFYFLYRVKPSSSCPELVGYVHSAFLLDCQNILQNMLALHFI